MFLLRTRNKSRIESDLLANFAEGFFYLPSTAVIRGGMNKWAMDRTKAVRTGGLELGPAGTQGGSVELGMLGGERNKMNSQKKRTRLDFKIQQPKGATRHN